MSRRVWAARPDRFDAWSTEVLIAPNATVTTISSFGEDEAGDIYLVDRDAGKVFAIDGPPLTAVVSRKTHMAAGDFELDIDTSRAAGDFVTVEPRFATGGGSHLVVFKFSVPISATGTASSVDEAGAAVGTAVAAAGPNEVLVTLGSIPAVQRVQVRLANVNGAGINVQASLGFLVGDVNGSGSVTASDILRTKGWSGLPADIGNSVYDVDLSSGINSLDVNEVKARAGLSL